MTPIGDFRLEITPEIRLRDHMYALQQTTEWKDRYKIRAGIEATNSELKRAHGIGRLRVRRIAKVCFAVACKVIACNIKRWAKAHIGLEKDAAGLHIVFLCSHEAMVRPDRGVLIQETDLLDDGNTIVVTI